MFWNVAFFPLKLIIPFLAGIVLVRELRAEGFAVYGLSLALLDFLGLFSDFGIDRTLPRYLPEVELKYGRQGITRLMSGVTGIKGVVILLVVLSLALAPTTGSHSSTRHEPHHIGPSRSRRERRPDTDPHQCPAGAGRPIRYLNPVPLYPLPSAGHQFTRRHGSRRAAFPNRRLCAHRLGRGRRSLCSSHRDMVSVVISVVLAVRS